MIDNPEKTAALLRKLKSLLPIEAMIPQHLRRALMEKSPDFAIPARCTIVALHYAGDEGGLLCHLNFDGAETERPHIVSVTHLSFERRTPLFREIEAYQRHRIKKLKQQFGRG